jgi:hypothetical protein
MNQSADSTAFPPPVNPSVVRQRKSGALDRPTQFSQPPKHDPQWAEAKQVCRLNMEDIRMAKALGMSPKSLMKNNPSPTQRWKLPVKDWIHELYAKRFGHQAPLRLSPKPPPKPAVPVETEAFDDSVPF